MNLVNKFKGSLQKSIGNETIGDLGFNLNPSEETNEVKSKKIREKPNKKTRQPKPEKPPKINKPDIEVETEDFSIDEVVQFEVPEFTDEIQDFQYTKNFPILEILGIEKDINIDGYITELDIENTEFTLTAPTGINPKEVEVFCNKLQRDVSIYRNLILSRQEDFMKLLEEALKLESKLVKRQNENELANFVITQKNNEEKLKELVVELRIENQELKNRLARLENNTTTQNNNNNNNKRSLPQPPRQQSFEDEFADFF